MKYFASIYFGYFLILTVANADAEKRKDVVPKVLGGIQAKNGQFPYAVYITLNGQFYCGGSIISNCFVLTAAHCMDEPKENYEICAGSVNIHSCETRRRITNYTNHENHALYNGYDIAILKTNKPFMFNDRVKPIRLLKTELRANTDVTVCGWGAISNSYEYTDVLLYNTFKTFDDEQCDAPNILCLQARSGVGSCNGDSGGPAVANRKLAGINSYGGICGIEGDQDSFTKVSAHYRWIKRHMSIM